MKGYPVFRIIMIVGSILLPAPVLSASVLEVPAQGGDLKNIVGMAKAGTIVRLKPGVHQGPIVLSRRIVLQGMPGAVIDAGGASRALTVSAPGTVVRGITVRATGRSLATEDTGIFVTEEANGAVIENNTIRDSLIGIYLKGPKDVRVKGNKIFGLTDMRVNERGNGIQIWRSSGSLIEQNEIRNGRDGIFVTTSRRNVFRGNYFEGTRIAVHYMYTNDSEVSENRSVNNHVGYALMYSKKLIVRRNVSENDRDHGILLNYANRSLFEGNLVRNGKTKCVFIYNSSKNEFRRNHFENCAVGIHFTAGSERNRFTENAFVGNRHQVKYVGTGWLDWSVKGRGNYWSDNPAFDLDGDGISDTAYKPNDLVDEVLWAYPVAKLLINSPAARTLRWAQRRFPALYPGGVVDSAPLMKSPALPVPANQETAR